MAALVIYRIRRNRRNFRPERLFRDRRNPLDSMRDDELYEKYRFHRQELLEIVDELADDVDFSAPRKGSLSPVMQVPVISLISLSLCYLAYCDNSPLGTVPDKLHC